VIALDVTYCSTLNVVAVIVNPQDCLRIGSSRRLGAIVFGLVGIVVDVE
jgi:hypothetical protein